MKSRHIGKRKQRMVAKKSFVVTTGLAPAWEDISSGLTETAATPSASQNYLKSGWHSDFQATQSAYVLLDVSIISNIINIVARCPTCKGNVNFTHMLIEKKGESYCFKLMCNRVTCCWTKLFDTSKEANIKDKQSRGRKAYGINYLACIPWDGKGLQALKIFCGIMKKPP